MAKKLIATNERDSYQPRDERREAMETAGAADAEAAGHDLSVSAYVMLGLLAMYGPQTPYEMKKQVDCSIGYFWDFPRAQLYVDPGRLARLGLVAEEHEAGGRRRHTYTITQTGVEALRHWLHESATREVELRDTGLLKLYFGALLDQSDIVALAQREAALHRRRLATYEAIQVELADDPSAVFALATIRMGLRYEQLSVSYWDELVATPPKIATPTENA